MALRTAFHIGLMACVAGAAGCRSKLDVHSQSGTPLPATAPAAPTPPAAPPNQPAPPAAPADKSTEAASTQTYFQSRDTISLVVDKDLIAGADTFSVLNVTQSGDDDSKALTLLSDQVPSFGLTPDGSYSITVKGDQAQIDFYPPPAGWSGKFFYGVNKVKVIGNDAFAIVNLTLQDFDVFGVAMTAFPPGAGGEVSQVATTANGLQFQGWLNVLSPPAVAVADGTTLTQGVFSIVNPQ